MKNDFAKYLSDFLLHYLPSERNASQNTIRTYRDTFRIFLKYCETVKGLKVDKIRVSDMKRILILDFLDWLETSQNNSVNSRNNRLAALHSFFRYMSGGELKFQPTAILPQINFVTLYLYLLQRAVYYRTLFSFLFLTFLSRFCIFIS